MYSTNTCLYVSMHYNSCPAHVHGVQYVVKHCSGRPEKPRRCCSGYIKFSLQLMCLASCDSQQLATYLFLEVGWDRLCLGPFLAFQGFQAGFRNRYRAMQGGNSTAATRAGRLTDVTLQVTLQRPRHSCGAPAGRSAAACEEIGSYQVGKKIRFLENAFLNAFFK